MQVDTVKIKADNQRGYRIINKSEFNSSSQELYEPAEGEDAGASTESRRSDADRYAERYEQELAAKKRAEGNSGQVNGNSQPADPNRNPSGTFSEPTPTDIRYPNKDETEFENNHGAFVNRSAADLRAELDLPDAPGGLNPEKHAEIKAEEEAAALRSAQAVDESKQPHNPFAKKDGAPAPEPAAPVDESNGIDTMTVDELKAYAQEHDIDLTGATLKADILAAIKAAEAEKINQ